MNRVPAETICRPVMDPPEGARTIFLHVDNHGVVVSLVRDLAFVIGPERINIPPELTAYLSLAMPSNGWSGRCPMKWFAPLSAT